MNTFHVIVVFVYLLIYAFFLVSSYMFSGLKQQNNTLNMLFSLFITETGIEFLGNFNISTKYTFTWIYGFPAEYAGVPGGKRPFDILASML